RRQQQRSRRSAVQPRHHAAAYQRSKSRSGPRRRQARGRFGEPKVDLADLMLLSRQMHILLKAGVPIIRALSGLHESATNPTLRRTIAEVRESLESGNELSQALRRHPKVFPAFMVSLVRVGEVTGLLDEVFMRLSESLASEKK